VDLDANYDGTFNAIIYNSNWAAWSWNVGQSIKGLADHARQHGLRLVDVSMYLVNGIRMYAGIMIDNVVGLSAQLRTMYEGMPSGSGYGFRLKQWNGPVLANLQDDVVFEPASAIKTLIHLHAVRARQNSFATDTTPISYRHRDKPYPNMSDAGKCPIDAPFAADLGLDEADRSMMLNSDNRMSHGIYDYFQSHFFRVDSTAAALGLNNTTLDMSSCDRITHPNATTLQELEAIYEAGSLRTGFLNDLHRPIFRQNMDHFVWSSFLMAMIQQEQAAIGLGNDFYNMVAANSMGKGGAIATAGKYWRANGGIVAIPTSPAGTNFTFYTWSSFLNNVTATAATIDQIDDQNNAVWAEAFRQIVRDALASWKALGGM
jgi:hypothetical protein